VPQTNLNENEHLKESETAQNKIKIAFAYTPA
jgi:hypothetical protein